MRKNIAGVIVIVLLGFSLFVNRTLYYENRDLKKEVSELKNDPAVQAKEEVKTLVRKLSALVVLPEGEDPVVATVTDKDKLADQPAFAKAENGDKLVIYGQAGRAYLFDPNNSKLKDIIPVNIGDQGQVAGATKDAKAKVTPTQKATPTPTPTATPTEEKKTE